jgi:hypothetical protein
VKEADLASPLADVSAACFAYRARPGALGHALTVVPRARGALPFEFPRTKTRGSSSTSPAK